MSHVLVLDGHPDPSSFCAALARRYADGADLHRGTRLLALRDLDFDPVLHRGMRGDQALEPDLVEAQRAIEAARHVVVVSPIWWGSVPALLKGFLDRTFEAGWAYHYSERGLPVGHLAGRSGRLLLTTDSPGWYLDHVAGRPTERALGRGTLRFSGIRPVRVSRFGPVRTSTPQRRDEWLDDVGRLGERDASRLPQGAPPPVLRLPRREPAPAA